MACHLLETSRSTSGVIHIEVRHYFGGTLGRQPEDRGRDSGEVVLCIAKSMSCRAFVWLPFLDISHDRPHISSTQIISSDRFLSIQHCPPFPLEIPFTYHPVLGMKIITEDFYRRMNEALAGFREEWETGPNTDVTDMGEDRRNRP